MLGRATFRSGEAIHAPGSASLMMKIEISPSGDFRSLEKSAETPELDGMEPMASFFKGDSISFQDNLKCPFLVVPNQSQKVWIRRFSVLGTLSGH